MFIAFDIDAMQNSYGRCMTLDMSDMPPSRFYCFRAPAFHADAPARAARRASGAMTTILLFQLLLKTLGRRQEWPLQNGEMAANIRHSAGQHAAAAKRFVSDMRGYLQLADGADYADGDAGHFQATYHARLTFTP